MHAEEREESKVSSTVGRACKCGTGMRLGGMELRAYSHPSLTGLSLRISAGTTPRMENMAAGTKPVRLTGEG